MNPENDDRNLYEKLFSNMAGQKMRVKRAELGITQEELAEKVKLNTKHLGRLERGEKTPSSPTLIRIFYELKIDANELYDVHVQVLQQMEDMQSPE